MSHNDNGDKNNNINNSSSQESASKALDIVKFSCTFFLDILLHCRERHQIKQWIQTMKDIFLGYPKTAIWFIRSILGNNSTILREFVFHCGDSIARGTFVQLVGVALTSLYSYEINTLNDECLLPFLNYKASEIIQNVTQNTNDIKALFTAFIFTILKILPDIPSYLRSSDEYFNLIRDIATSIPPIRNYLNGKDMIAFLGYFISPDSSNPQTKEKFSHSHKFSSNDVKPLYVVIFEAIAALLSIPQKQKVSLLVESSHIWDPELTEEAKEALAVIFKENSHYGGMDSRDIINYMDRVHDSDDSVPKVTAFQVRSILERYDTTPDGKLALSGFLRYYAETALYQPKSVWKVFIIIIIYYYLLLFIICYKYF